MYEKYMLIILLSLSLFLTFNRHRNSTYNNYHSALWADKAGYYVYLPALFIYNFNADEFPENIISKTGLGFSFDEGKNKVFTKYPCGVALMQLPFFLSAWVLSKSLGFASDGFSPVFHWSVMIAAVFYLAVGMYFLYKFLKNYFSKTAVFLTLLFIFTGTNLYYYAIDEGGMSHIYSFALFAMFLYFFKIFLIDKKTKHIVALAIISGLIVAVRPVNIIFLILFLFFDVKNISEIKARFALLFGNIKFLVIFLFCLSLIFFPQMLYWLYVKGNLFIYSYENESFTNWNSPKFIEAWFSPNNGLFIYSPLYLFILAGIPAMIKSRAKNGILIGTIFLIISYIFVSWWAWSYGCGYGHRCYVEYLALFSIPFAFLINKILNTDSRALKYSFFILIILLSVYNLKMIYTFDECWFGKSDWDWGEYCNLLTCPPK